MRYCEISTVNNKLNELSIIEPEGGKFQSLYAKTHFVLTKNDIVVKYNFVNEFEKFDIFRKRRSSRVQIAMSDKIQSELPDHNEPDPDFSMSYLRSNPIQMGLMFNKELDKTILVYSMPLPQRKEDSLMPSALDKPLWIISFDSELQPTEKLIIDKPGFWATMCYSVENKIFLVSNREIYTITL